MFDSTAATPAIGGSFAIADSAENIGTQVVSGLSNFVTDVNVTLNITHPNVGDLAIILQAPSGDQVLLYNLSGGAGDNFANTVFDDSASKGIGDPAAAAPFTGSFRPETPLSIFTGLPEAKLIGTWSLRVFDFFAVPLVPLPIGR